MAGVNLQSGLLDQRVALDVQGVESLRRAARQSPEEGLRQVSKQFEAIFMNMVLKSMRDAVPSSGMFESQGQKLYQSMLDQQLAQTMSGRGLGLADAMYAQLRRNLPADAGQAAAASATAGRESLRAAPSRAAAASATSTPQPAAQWLPVPVASAIRQPRAAATPLAPLAAPPVAPPAAEPSRGFLPALRTQAKDFVARVADAARTASEATGVPRALIVAQAALESGWGRREIRGADGTPSFNLFGIKADRAWRGPVTEAVTTEFVDGAMQRVTARFRAYGSYEEAFADYAKFLTGNPRYARVLSAPDAEQAAAALQHAGYASDPGYAGKLVRLMRRLF